MTRQGVRIFLIGLMSMCGVAAASEQSAAPDEAAIEALAKQPERFRDTQVRLTLFKALESPAPAVVAAAVDVVMSAPELVADPQLWKRFNAALSSADPARRQAILDRASKKQSFDDVRVLAVIVEGLTDKNEALRSAALGIVQSQPALRQHPAVADALTRSGEPVPNVVLPSFDEFKTRVQPVLDTLGSDKKKCSGCHEDHSVLRLPPIDAAAAMDEQLQQWYRAALRVVNLETPEKSLILRKPTSPKREAAFTHGGGVRFEKDSPPYQAILGWIKSGEIRR